MNRPQRYQPNRHYSSALTIRTHSSVLPRQTNGTVCGIFTLLYHRTLSNWYGRTVGQTFTQGHIQELLRSLEDVTLETAHEYRRKLRIQMHTWWTGTWEGPNPVLPPRVHQRNLQMRRQRRREQQEPFSDRTQRENGDPENTDTPEQLDGYATDGQKQQTVESSTTSSPQQASATSHILQNCNRGDQSPRISKPKRMRSDKNSEAKRILVELVEQEMSSLPSHGRVTQQSLEALASPDTDVSNIPEHILAESREMKGNDKMATAARQRSYGRYTTYTV
jgi:hypothetical protein